METVGFNQQDKNGVKNRPLDGLEGLESPKMLMSSLVNVQKNYMENHHFSWVNPLFRLGHFQ